MIANGLFDQKSRDTTLNLIILVQVEPAHQTEKEIRIANRRSYEKTDKFKDRYRWRSGIEATMSEYERRTGLKRLQVSGLKAVRFCATLKALGINLLRAAVVWMATNAMPEEDRSAGHSSNHVFCIIKERFLIICRRIECCFKEINIISIC